MINIIIDYPYRSVIDYDIMRNLLYIQLFGVDPILLYPKIESYISKD